jgi:hypothetical protein
VPPIGQAPENLRIIRVRTEKYSRNIRVKLNILCVDYNPKSTLQYLFIHFWLRLKVAQWAVP